ncbi:MAG: hypothetical protein SCH71_02120 [Desulfobulbaceae bacterium]|nr:hypothetical protein [Desulfobulbaceae bacterium]
MRFVIIAGLAAVLLCNNSYGQENIYTWRDKEGVLNITDYPPPGDAELLEISQSHREEAIKLLRERRILQAKIEEYLREKRREQEELREQARKAAAMEEAAELLEEAENMRNVQGELRKRRRFGWKAESLEEKAKELIMDSERVEKPDDTKKKSSGY